MIWICVLWKMAAPPYNGIMNVCTNNNRWMEENGTFQHMEIARTCEIPLTIRPSRHLDIANDHVCNSP